MASLLFSIDGFAQNSNQQPESAAKLASKVNADTFHPIQAPQKDQAKLTTSVLNDSSGLDLSQNLEELSFSDLVLLNDQQWQPRSNKNLYLSSDTRISLIKLQIQNRFDMQDQAFIEIASNHLESADLYQYDAEKNVIKKIFKSSGNLQRFDNRPINYRHVVYPVHLPPDSSVTLLLKVDNHYPTKLKLQLWNETEFVNKLNRELIFFGMIYGSLLMIVIYNLFVYVSLKEKNHLLFFIFGAFAGLFISIHEGHFAQFVAPDMSWSKSLLLSCISALMCFSFSFFSVYILDAEKHNPLMHQVLLIAGSVCSVFLLLLGFSNDHLIFSSISFLIILSLYAIAIWIGIRIWHKGVTSAGFFSLAIFLSSLGLFAEYISQIPFTNILTPSYSYATIGYTGMIFVFAYALADKMRLLQQEKLDASLKLVKLTEEKAQSNLEIYKSKLSEVQLEKEAQAARLQLQAKSEFLSLMSHEIRTPMNSLMGMSELLRDTALTKEQQSYVNSITNSSNALLNVINDVLDFSQFESGKMELDSRLFSLEKVIDECTNIFALSSNENKLTYLAYVDPKTPDQLKGDAEKIKQVALNLLGQISQQSNIDSIAFVVEPTGKTTVNSVDIEFQFFISGNALDIETFQQWTLSLEEIENGEYSNELGLTLNVSQQLIELMNGVLSVNEIDLSDSGSNDVSADQKNIKLSFTARLLNPHSDEELPTEDRKSLLKDRKILICHSNHYFVDIIQKLTQSWGMKTTVATHAKDVGELLHNEKKTYQLLLIENQLLSPEVQLWIRQANVAKNFSMAVAVINDAQTSLTQDDMKKRGIRCFFDLPFTTGQLYQTVLNSMGIEQENEDVDQTELKVLVAEDNAVNLMVIEGILRKQGVNPISCVNGQEAVKLANKAPGFDVIFMDCEMPELDGFEATTAIRAEEAVNENQKPSLIIGLSAHATSASRQQAMSAGMHDFLTKPIKPEDIEQIILNFHRKENQS